MRLNEVGLVVNGIPLIRIDYSKNETSIDPYIQTSLFSAILSFANKVLQDDPEEMRFRKYVIVINSLSANPNQPKFLYATAERGLDIGEMKRRLRKVEEKIEQEELSLEVAAGATEEIDVIKKMIDNEFRDLGKGPGDRISDLFG